MTLAALAQATKRLRVGVLVTGIHYRHPAVLANMAATLDITSGGRLDLCIGAGWNEEESGAYGIELGTCQLSGARCEPKSVQQPHPPICIGGKGEQRTLRSAARSAQHWNYPGGPVEEFVAKREVLHRHCSDIDRDPAEIMTSTHLRLGSDGNPGPVVLAAKAYADAGLDLGIVYLPAPHTPSVLEPLAAALAPLR